MIVVPVDIFNNAKYYPFLVLWIFISTTKYDAGKYILHIKKRWKRKLKSNSTLDHLLENVIIHALGRPCGILKLLQLGWCTQHLGIACFEL